MPHHAAKSRIDIILGEKIMKNLRLRTKLGLIIGILVLCVAAVALIGYLELGVLNRRVEQMVETTSKTAFLMSEIWDNAQRARRLEFRAVITTDDKESTEYADQSRKIAKLVDDAFPTLSGLIDQNSNSPDRLNLEKFHGSWQEYRKIQDQTLILSLENSNFKAHKLAVGKVAEKVTAINQSTAAWLRQLDKMIVETAQPNDNKRLEAIDKDRQALHKLQAIALDMHRQLNQYVYDASAEEMDRLDEQIAAWQKEAETLLAEMTPRSENKDLPGLEAVSSAFRDLKPLASQMQKLLRANTISRTSELLNSANKPMDDCRAAAMSLSDSLHDRLKTDMSGIHDTSAYTQWLMLIAPLIGISLSLCLAVLLTKSITAPMARGVKFSEAIAQGDLTQRINLSQSDEVGQLTQAIDHAASAFSRVVKDIRDTSRGIDVSASELSSVSHQMLVQSEEMTTQAGYVASSTEQMTTNVSTMAAAAEEMSMNVMSISSASEEISVNVGTISSAAEATTRNVTAVSGAIQESTQTFEAISRDAREGSTIADKALKMADSANSTMQGLDHSASEIDKVTETIKMIALQTNLLALNATIEATTAGEAGKGFAVVANEIKELANQSAKAAEDIARKIEGVQTSTRVAVQVIREVQDIIQTLNVSSGRIAESVEKQSCAAKISAGNLSEASKSVEHIALSIAEVAKGAGDMSRNASEAAQGANDVSRNASEAAKAVADISSNIHGVSQATRDNTASAQQVNAAAERLASIAGQLQQLVGRFKIEE
jgi:methyl-accepting chemotaxis protein